MDKNRAMVMLCCVAVLLVVASPVFGQVEEPPPLKDRRITIRMESQPLGTVFRYLMEKYDIPIGFEQSVLDRDHSLDNEWGLADLLDDVHLGAETQFVKLPRPVDLELRANGVTNGWV